MMRAGKKGVRFAMKAALRCHCGQRIFARDVVQRGTYIRQFGPPYVYVRYRCSRCRKLGEQYIKQEDWDVRVLMGAVSEVTAEERRRFEQMGPITAEEQKSIRNRLLSLTLPSTDDPA